MSVYSQEYDNITYDPAAPVIDIIISHPVSDGNQVSLVAMMDTGADATMLPFDELEKVGARFLETRQMRGATGHILVVDTYLVTIRLGPHTLHGVQAVAMQSNTESIVGRDVLNQLEIILNGPAHVVEIVS